MRKFLAGLTLLLTSVLAAAPPSSAHEGQGTIEVSSSMPAGDFTLRYQLQVTYVADGHGSPDATVTATVVDPSGARTPVPFTKGGEDGIYEGAVTYPAAGNWTVRFTSLRPTATLERLEEVAAPAPTTTSVAASTTTAATTSDATDEGPADRGPAEGKSPLAIYLAGVVVAVAIGAALLLARRGSSGPT
jgi:hypothetical protein